MHVWREEEVGEGRLRERKMRDRERRGEGRNEEKGRREVIFLSPSSYETTNPI
jgi:hypothetical protein